MDDRILKAALENAVDHGGEAQEKAVLGKVIREVPELREKIQDLRPIIAWVVRKVNTWSQEEQRLRLQELGGPRERVQKRPGLTLLEGAEEGKVVTRFAPAPTGPLTILQVLRAVLISYAYARKYKGTFIVRFEDTDPKVISKEFYDMIRDDLRALDVEWDKEYLQSDYLNLYYKEAELLLTGAKAYVCFCLAEDFQLLKRKKEDCPHRWQRPDNNILGWNGMLSGRYPEGKAVVRLLTSMQDPNPAMRDPPLLRIASGHPLKKEQVWPLYNFANVVMDSFCRVTHVFRGKEHEHNTAIQEKIYHALGKKPPRTVNFGMMYLPGEKLHTRDIKAGIADGTYSGWDDLRLPTVRAYLRRGFQAKAFHEFSIICGLSKNDIRIDVGNLEAINRQIVDLNANRYMMVTDPMEIDIGKLKKQTGLGNKIEKKNHPERDDTRDVQLADQLLVSGEDFKRFQGREVRLIDLFNVILEKEPVLGRSQEFDMKTPKIQWVSKGIPATILFPDRSVIGVAEPALGKAKTGDIVQLLRVGFGRIERPGIVVFAHK